MATSWNFFFLLKDLCTLGVDPERIAIAEPCSEVSVVTQFYKQLINIKVSIIELTSLDGQLNIDVLKITSQHLNKYSENEKKLKSTS